ncbi:MAG: hypothetical protein Q8942_14290 [Bacillota bacterium]|nr:hypothetical protein [Bacillota bacterium]
MLKNQRFILLTALFLLILAGTIYYFNNIRIPGLTSKLEKDIRAKVDVAAMPKTRVAVIGDKEGIPRYTLLTDEIINSKVKIIDAPVDFVAGNAAVDLDMIRNKIAKEDLRFGEQIVLDSLSTEQKWFGDFDRLKEFAVHSIVAGEVKPGNIVDLIVNYRNGSYDVVVPKTKVRKIYKSESKDGSVDSYTLIFSLDESNYRDVLLASKLGYLETRLYIDESQKASPKTFNYSAQSSKIPHIKIDEKDQTIVDVEPINKPDNASVQQTNTNIQDNSIQKAPATNSKSLSSNQKPQINVER